MAGINYKELPSPVDASPFRRLDSQGPEGTGSAEGEGAVRALRPPQGWPVAARV